MALKGNVATKLTPETEVAPVQVVDHSVAAEVPFFEDGEETSAVETQLQPTVHVPAQPVNSVLAIPAGEDDGFAALDKVGLGFSSFPALTLKDGMFSCDGHKFPEFKCQLIQARSKWAYKQSEAEDAEIFYSGDNEYAGDGRSVKVRLAEWKAAGYGSPVVKEYLDVLARMFDGPLESSLVMLSISPQSIMRFSGYRTELAVLYKRATPKQVLTRVFPGKSVGAGKKAFHPWNFARVRALTPDELL